MTQPLRFGYTGSVHLLPLLYPLLAGWIQPAGRAVTWHDLPPGALLAELDAGTLDGALVAPVAYARRRGQLALLPGVGLASEGQTAQAVLVSAARADLLDQQALQLPAAPTDEAGAALLAVLLQPYFGIAARLLPPDGSPPAGVALGGTLVTGNVALAARRPWLLYEAYLRTVAPPDPAAPPSRPAPVSAPDPATAGYATDLGAAWWVLTGVPMVWALGVLREPLHRADPALADQLVAAFQEARRTATEQRPSVLAAAAQQVALPEAVLAALFAVQTPLVGPREYGALDAYLTYTRRLGLTR